MAGLGPPRGADAICCFNRVHSQGMHWQGCTQWPVGTPRRSVIKTSGVASLPLTRKGIGQGRQIAGGSDLAVPGVQRMRTDRCNWPMSTPRMGPHRSRVEPYFVGQCWKVMHTVDFQTRLLRPSVMLWVAIPNMARSLRREHRTRCAMMLTQRVAFRFARRNCAVIAHRRRGVVPGIRKGWIVDNRSLKPLNPAAPMALSPANRSATLEMSVTAEWLGRL